MPSSADIKSALGKPELLKLKALGEKCKVDKVMGNRVLIKTIDPFTDLDRIEKEGKLYIPEHIKKDNTPLPSTGFVVQIGTGVSDADRADLESKDGFPVAVMFSKFAGSDWFVEEENFKICDLGEVMCIVKFEAPVVPVKGE